MAAPQLGPGVCLSGYLISEEIGRGGSSRVFRAEPPGGGAPVAIKVAASPELASLLRSEDLVLRVLAGPRFVRVLEAKLDEDPPFLVLELLSGGDLRRKLEDAPRSRLAPDEARRIFETITEGVALAHAEGLVHGDLKPENVLLDARGEPRIADLGLSREGRARLVAAAVAASLPSTDGVAGTLDYLAPEVRRGELPQPASDVFALGVILHELLVGKRPLGLFEPVAVALARDGVAVPAEFDRVVARALSQERRERYADASELLADLRGAAASREPVPARPRPGSLPLVLATERGEAVDGLVAFAVIALGPLLGFSLLGAIPLDRDNEPPLARDPLGAIGIGLAILGGLLAFMLALLAILLISVTLWRWYDERADLVDEDMP